MKQMKRLLACLIAGLITVSIFAGCSKIEGDQSSSDDSSSELSQDESSSEEDSSSEAPSSSEESSSEPDSSSEPEPTGYPPIISDEKLVKYDAVVAIGDTAYELYGYVESRAEKYAAAVNNTAAALDGISTVYSMVIPTSVGITFPDNYKDKIEGSDVGESIQKLDALMAENVKKVDLYPALMSHRDEYIFFRTDHHWTALGAYYGYEQFCAAKGFVPNAIVDYKQESFEGFLGSFYKDTGESEALGRNPDTVTAYHPVTEGDIKLTFTQTDGKSYEWPIIGDVSGYKANMKYSTFAGADNPYTVIENASVTDGSSCIVVKESFGNALIPFLADHFSVIFEIDYRYYDKSVISLAKEKKVDDVIFANNISMTRSDYLIGKLSQVVQ